MRTPYIKHFFGEEVKRKLGGRTGWLTASVASSIAWPSDDVCVVYDGEDYFLRGTEVDGKPNTPCITVACPMGKQHIDEAIAKVYRFTSILSWFEGGYVDVTGYISGSHPSRYGDRQAHSALGIAGTKSFNCNHMPIVEDENSRKALAFWREGQRLDRVHDSYSFLSFFKVIESQYSENAKALRKAWVAANIDNVKEERALRRIAELRAEGLDVGDHLYASGRCAVAHASLGKEIVDPDIPADRRRLSADLVVMKELARLYIRDELKVPDSRSLYRTRDRLLPWASLLPGEVLAALKRGEPTKELSSLHEVTVSVGMWPDGPIPGLERMTMFVHSVGPGYVRVVLRNDRHTVQLVFVLDFTKGQLHTQLDDGGLIENEPHAFNEDDVRAYHTFFYKVLGNGIAELTIDGREPVDCEVVIPVNIMLTKSPEDAVAATVEDFRKAKAAGLAPKAPARE